MRTRIIEGGPAGAGELHIGVAAAEWNHNITSKLVDGALVRLESLGVGEVTVLWVPGSLELPVAAQRLAKKGCDAVIAIGVVIEGDTDHYQIVAFGASEGIQRVALDEGIPVGNAILAVHDVQDAVERAG
ncbi:MAG: 6,7-dimethyl-8-ribityllumazine synthase, partial [Acidimicrobiia bacterium]|nr:6,7-dimethyl-8-ribityllumazine synthase [Acidimicrobiia bacterium]